MDLLPKNHDQFRQTEYWDSFFKKRGRRAFEWYGEYAELCGILHKYIKAKDNVLVVGCGNSTLSADLYDVGYKNMVNVDISEVVVRQMKAMHARERPGLRFELMDVTDLAEFGEGSFSCVLDKGTLDAMFTSDKEDVVQLVDKMFAEIDRVLRLGGRYICISLLQPHILDHLTAAFAAKGWPLRIVRCKEAENSRPPEDRIFPVFAVIATKFKKMPNMPQVFEMCLSSFGQTSRLKSSSDLVNSVRGIQQFSAVRAGATKNRLFNKDARQEDVSLDLRSADSDIPKYSLFLVDREQTSQLKFAVFIVPQGRETEWLFSTTEGRRQLAVSANCSRLVVVHLQRAHTFQNLKAVQDELSGFVLELAPANLESNVQVPFLSLGQEDVGERTERSRGNSKFSGEFVVEDVSVNGECFRRLVFLNNPNLTQSEAKLKIVKLKNKKIKKFIDTNYLACVHHSLMIASLGTFSEPKIKCLLVGLGGGALASFIVNKFEKTTMDVVELDPAIARVAAEQFEFSESSRLKLILDDGLKYISSYAASEKYSVIMFDVDSKDSTIGMSCPPKPFLEKGFLQEMKEKCLERNGLFVLNLVCRDPALRESTLSDLHGVFESVLSYKVPEEVNEILYCGQKMQGGGQHKRVDLKHPFVQAFKSVNETLRDQEFIDVAEALKQLKIA